MLMSANTWGSAAYLAYEQPDLRRVKGAVALREGEHGVLAGAHDVPLLNLGGVGIVSQGVLQSAKLLARVAAKGVDRPPGEEHLALVEKPPSDGSKYKIMLRLTAQQLNGVGVAVDE